MALVMMLIAVQGHAQSTTEAALYELPPVQNKKCLIIRDTRPDKVNFDGRQLPSIENGNKYNNYTCEFFSSQYVEFLGEENRFVLNTSHKDMYFDTYLGIYIFGKKISKPERIKIEGVDILRDLGYLRVMGDMTNTFRLWKNRIVVYKIGYNTVEIATGEGDASIYIYDEYGNSIHLWL